MLPAVAKAEGVGQVQGGAEDRSRDASLAAQVLVVGVLQGLLDFFCFLAVSS